VISFDALLVLSKRLGCMPIPESFEDLLAFMPTPRSCDGRLPFDIPTPESFEDLLPFSTPTPESFDDLLGTMPIPASFDDLLAIWPRPKSSDGLLALPNRALPTYEM
jgi:hypothetical protein